MFRIEPKRLSKHERYVLLLSRIVESEYDEILLNVPIYSKRRRLVGEIDLVGIKDGAYDIFEVKCSHRIMKAKRQLEKIRNHMRGYAVKDMFFFCGASRALISVQEGC